MGSHDAFPDAILELVLLCLNSPPCLLRAAATCKRWRRIITSDHFRRAFHKTPLLVAGYYYNDEAFIRPRYEPSPSAAVDAGHFSLDFLPGYDDPTTNWCIKDSHGSLLLLVRESRRTQCSDLIVCEPLTQLHELISCPLLTPPATAIFLNNGGGATGTSNLRVLCLVDEASCVRAFMFTSGSSTSWSCLEMSIDRQPALHFFGVAAGRWFWHDRKKRVFALALNETTLELSSFMLPDEDDWHPVFIIRMVSLAVGRDGEARIVVDGGGNSLKIFARVRDGDDGEDWALEKTMQVSPEMLGLPELRGFFLTWHQPMVAGTVEIRVPVGLETAARFRLDMETTKAERLLEPDVVPVPNWKKAYPSEFPWPPSLCAACCVEPDDNT